MNKEELLIGAIIPWMFIYWYGWWAILISPICSILWSLSGATRFDKFWRRIGVPTVICLSLAIKTGIWFSLVGILPAWGSLSIGYGLPSTQPPDEGSALGRFWWRVCRKNEFMADLTTRGTIYLLMFFSIALCLIGGAKCF
jgi:hypothetical protein